MSELRVVEWFSGIKAFTKALHKQGIEYTMVDSVELDKHAIKSQNALYGTNYVPTDINNVDVKTYGEVDILVAGWPCTSLSTAGLQKGMGNIIQSFYLEPTISNISKWYYEANKNGTYGDFINEYPSALIYTSIVKINEMKTKPKFIILENVKGLLSERFANDLNVVKKLFAELGYDWNQALLNSKYFGVPQSRERVFIVLTRNDLLTIDISSLEQRKEVSKTLKDIIDFDAPANTIILRDDNHIDFTNFYTIPRASDGRVINGFHNRVWKAEKTSGTICSAAVPKIGWTHNSETKKVYFVNELKNYNGKIIELDIDKFNNQSGDEINKVAKLGELINNTVRERERETNLSFQEHSFNQKKDFLGVEDVSKTLRAGDCDAENKIVFEHIPFKSDMSFIGVVGQSPTMVAESPTMVAESPNFKNKILWDGKESKTLHYRSLTPQECLMLMGFEKNDYDNLRNAGVSDSQICKQTGNSIVVNVLEEIIKIILKNVL